MTVVLKVLFIGASTGAAVFSARAFGPGIWSAVFVAVPLLVAASIKLLALQPLAHLFARISGVLAALAFALLMLAATTGGSFNMDDDNTVFAVLLAAMAVFGLSAFGWRLSAPATRDP